MIDDRTLLGRYATERTEEAFAEFVRRHLPLVYSTALRRLGGDAHGAEDVAQLVFSAAAREARRLSQHEAVIGWLYTTTRNAVIDAQRADHRRRAREKEAHAMSDPAPDPTTTADWSRLGPVLDAAMDELNGDDRAAVLLRFFQERPFADIGASLGLSEDAARKRVERALDKLGAVLRRHGIASTAAALGTLLAGNAIGAVPAGLAAGITSAALAAGGATVGAAAILTLSKLQAGIAAVIVAGGAVGLVSQQRTIQSLRTSRADTLQQVARLTTEKDAFAKARADADADRARLEAELSAVQNAPTPAAPSVQPPNRATPAGQSSTPPAPTSRVGAALPPTPPLVLGPLPDTPEIRRQKASWHRRYAAFFRQRGMTAAEAERFVELKVHQGIEWQDFQAAVRAANLRGDSAQVQALRSQDVNPVTRGLHELLGEEGYAAYRRYEDISFYRMNYVEPLDSPLRKAGLVLSEPQAEELTQLFRTHARHLQARPTDIGTTTVIEWDAVVAAAGGILAPAQLDVLRTHAERMKATQRSP